MTTTALTVADFAEATGVSINQLIDELRQHYPGMKWSGKAVLPLEFINAARQQAAKYEAETEAQQPIANLTKADPQNLVEALKDTHTSVDAWQYGILEALADSTLELYVYKAIEDAERISSTYTTIRNQLLEQKLNNSSTSDRVLIAEIIKRMEVSEKTKANEADLVLGKFTQSQALGKQRLEVANQYLEQYKKAIATGSSDS